MPAKAIRSVILENELSQKPLSPRDLARREGLKQSSIHRARVRLRHEGLLKPSTYQRAKAARIQATPQGKRIATLDSDLLAQAAKWSQTDVEAIVNSEVMPELERLQKLSNMARFGPDAISIAAIKALEDLGRARGQTVGPGKPLTVADQVARLSRLMTAVGRKVSEQAFRVAFDPKPVPEATLEAPEAILEGAVPPPEASEQGLEANVELSKEISQEHQGPPISDSSLGGLNSRIEP